MKINDKPVSPGDRRSGPAAVHSKLSWTDFHTVLQIARQGSVARTCPLLGTTHSTLLRKLDQIETRLNTRLFERVRGRYTLTPAGHQIAEAAQSFEPVAAAAEAQVRGQDLRPSGLVRVSAAAIVIDRLMPRVLRQFASAFPDVRIELAASREHVSLRRREADVAIRITDVVPDWLVGRKLADLRFRIYGRRRGSASMSPRSIESLARERRWIGFEQDARELKFDRWLIATVPEESVVLRVDSFSQALTMTQAGLGIAILPVFLETGERDLQPLSEPIAALQTPLWLITHPELKNTTRIKVLMRAFAPALANAVSEAQDQTTGG